MSPSYPPPKHTTGPGPKEWHRWLLGLVAGGLFMAAGFYMLYYEEDRPPLPMPAELIKEATFFFSSSDGKSLAIEKRVVDKGIGEGTEARISALIEELILGSKLGYGPVLPDGTRLNSVRVEGDVADIDISREVIDNHWGGSNAELQTVYGVVNTVVLNVDGIEKVQILIDGEVVKTIAGHIRVELPLGTDMGMVRN